VVVGEHELAEEHSVLCHRRDVVDHVRHRLPREEIVPRSHHCCLLRAAGSFGQRSRLNSSEKQHLDRCF
jgi:hypothetical protein